MAFVDEEMSFLRCSGQFGYSQPNLRYIILTSQQLCRQRATHLLNGYVQSASEGVAIAASKMYCSRIEVNAGFVLTMRRLEDFHKTNLPHSQW